MFCVFDGEETVRGLQPDMAKLLDLDGLPLRVTAPGADADSVSRTLLRSSTSPRTRCTDPAIATLHQLNARIAELNDGSFVVDDQETPRVEAL